MAVLEDLTKTLKQRVKLWVPAATNSSLDSLTLNVQTVETPLPGGGMSTKVSVVCLFARDVSASGAKQTSVLDACKGEAETARECHAQYRPMAARTGQRDSIGEESYG